MIKIHSFLVVLILMQCFVIKNIESCKSGKNNENEQEFEGPEGPEGPGGPEGGGKSFTDSCRLDTDCGNGLKCSAGKCICTNGTWNSNTKTCA